MVIRHARIALSTGFALVYLEAVGFTALRAEAVTSGAVLGWDNTVISATNAGSPWLRNLFVAGLSGLLIFWCVRDSSGDGHSRVYPALCAFGVLFLGTVWFSVTRTIPSSPTLSGVRSRPKPVPSSCGPKPVR